MEKQAYKILVADDEKEIRDILKLLLSEEGYEVVEAENGKVAVDLAGEDVSLYILDVNMPVMSGFAAGAQIRKRYDAPMMYLTAYSGEADMEIGFSAGADDYMVKPFSNVELMLRVRALLRRAARYTAPAGESTGRKDAVDEPEALAAADGRNVNSGRSESDERNADSGRSESDGRNADSGRSESDGRSTDFGRSESDRRSTDFERSSADRRNAALGNPAVEGPKASLEDGKMEAVSFGAGFQSKHMLPYKDLVLDLDSQSVWKGEMMISLTRTEFQILELFFSHPKKIYSMENIYQSIWHEDAVGDSTIMVHIKNLRKKLGDSSRNPQYIKTAWGKGYYAD